jgi:beta-glucosidase
LKGWKILLHSNLHRAVCCLAIGLLSCSFSQPVATGQQSTSKAAPAVKSQKGIAAVPKDALYKRASAPIETRVRDLLQRMTVEEKARQLDMYAGVPDLVDKSIDATHVAKDGVFRTDQAEKLIGSLGVGSIHDLYGSAAFNNQIQAWVIEHSRLGIPVLFAEEGLHGFNTGTIFPAQINLAATWNSQLARQTSEAIASEARATGVGMLFAPVLDLARDPRWGRVEEDFGEDPYLTGQMGLEYVKGMQGTSLATDHTLIAEPKHFAGHGSPESGTNMSPVHVGEREFRSVMLKSFEPAIRQGNAMGVMAAYHEIDGIPVTADPFLLKTILRKEWGFQGFVLSDLGAIKRLYDTHHVAASPKDAVVLAINSGVDMQFYDFDHATFQNAIIAGTKDGTLSPVALDRAVSSVLRVKFALGLFDHPMSDTALFAQVNRAQAHLDISLQSARQSMTLLKNDNHLLPISKEVKRIAVIGPNANVSRYGDYAPAETQGEHISLLSGLKSALPNADITFDEGSDIVAAIAKAKAADVVVLGLGENLGISGESFDRSSLDLPGNQQALLEAVVAANKLAVLVLENGRPLTIGWAKDHVPAILEAWYPGEFGGRAIAETLIGDNNPAGRLTITFPRSVGQLPDFYNFDPSKNHKYVDDDGQPLFVFGFGLSYTTFRYDSLNIKVSSENKDLLVTVNVTNTGTVDGDEVPQLYLREDVGSVETPDKALKGFTRIHLLAGENRTVSFHVPLDQLAVWNAEGKWAIEPGMYTIWAGGSSLAILTQKFKLSAVK